MTDKERIDELEIQVENIVEELSMCGDIKKGEIERAHAMLDSNEPWGTYERGDID